MADISELLEIMRRLRDPDGGCPWDLEQSYRSIAPYTLEEVHEVVDAIEREAWDELPGELGDLLFQIVFYSQLAVEEGRFGFDDVVDGICSKMRRRHPHVFGTGTVASARDQTLSWEAIKRGEGSGKRGVLSGIPATLPALSRAAKLGRRAAAVGFDWPDTDPVRRKIDEELAEADAAIEAGNPDEIDAELGDVLFAVVNLCRHAGVDPEQALRGANRRFALRFRHVEAAVEETGGDWSAQTLESLEHHWAEAKTREARGKR